MAEQIAQNELQTDSGTESDYVLFARLRMVRPVPTFASLAAEANPLEELEVVVERLLSATAESRYLEWKSGGLFGPRVTHRTKYRSVKAAISFANAEGGFLLFGVDPTGIWLGLADDEMAEFDPAKVTELINGVVYPDLLAINYAQFSHAGKKFTVVHIPPSPLVPHSTSREITEVDASGTRRVILAKHTVYYRHGAKSDSATPLQLQRIVEKRTLHVRDELVRRVREVPIPIISHGHPIGPTSGTAITFTRLTNDPSAPAVRLIRAPGQASGVLLHEELSDGLFDEINNVLDANNLLAGTESQFVFGEEIYYRVYAERHHVQPSCGHSGMLLKTACREIYAPFLFWLTNVPPRIVAEELIHAVGSPKYPMVLSAFRAFVLLGKEATAWLNRLLDSRYKRLPQPPEFYWTFKKIVGRTITDRQLLAMRTTGTAVLDVPDAGTLSVSRLLSVPEEAAAHLSRVCLRVFKGEGTLRTLARQLDIAAYGKQVEEAASRIWGEIGHLTDA